MNPQSAINSFRRQPLYFLRYYQLTIAGSTLPSQPVRYYIATRPGVRNQRPDRALGNLLMLSVRTFMISDDPITLQGGDTVGFDAHSIKMDAEGTTAVGAIGGYPLDGGGPDLMMTGQLNGCSFCILQDPGIPNRVWAAHIRPNPNNGYNLRNNLQANGHFAVAPVTAITVYGSRPPGGGFGYDHLTEVVSIAGVRQGGTWGIYSQVYDPFYAVIREEQIY